MSKKAQSDMKKPAAKRPAVASPKKAAAKKPVAKPALKPAPKQSPTPIIEKRKDYNALALALHKKHHGKLAVASKAPLKTKDDWSTLYTPGVAAVSSLLHKKPSEARTYTIKRNTVAVVSDGSAVLGLGNIGPLGALPVMEGKCAIFKEMADIDAWPIVLDAQEPEEIIRIVKAIAPGFGGINLEDIAAPKCFDIEARLKAELDIPVMHDDQHGTAVVVLAGLMNAAKVVKKKLETLKVVIVGAGAAGVAITKLLQQAGIKDIIVVDSQGALFPKRRGLPQHKRLLAETTNPKELMGDVMSVVPGADVLIGVSGPGTIAPAHIEAMAEGAIVFALANPIPEIMPKDALRAGAAVVATGRSDLPNQVNNALAFPGIFRGALDRGVKDITDTMKLAAAKQLAALVKRPTADCIIPPLSTPNLTKRVSGVIK